MVISMIKTHSDADYFFTFIEVKNWFNKDMYSIIWIIIHNTPNKIKEYIKGFSTLLKNRTILSIAKSKTASRLLLKSHKLMQAYLMSIPYFKKY